MSATRVLSEYNCSSAVLLPCWTQFSGNLTFSTNKQKNQQWPSNAQPKIRKRPTQRFDTAAQRQRCYAVCDRPAGIQISLQIGQISPQRQYRFNINIEIGGRRGNWSRYQNPPTHLRLYIHVSLSDRPGELILHADPDYALQKWDFAILRIFWIGIIIWP